MRFSWRRQTHSRHDGISVRAALLNWDCIMILAVLVIGVVGGSSGEVTRKSPHQVVNCTGLYSGVHTRDELYNDLLFKTQSSIDSVERVQIKRVFLRYLTRTPLFLSMINCNSSLPHTSRLLQEDGDDDDEGGGGAAGGVGGAGGNPLDNTNVIDGVRRILANVFTGNLVGLIQESVGLRSPEPVTTVFTDVLSTLFGSTATAGVTGILGNFTTTEASVFNGSSTLPPGYEEYIRDHYAQQQFLAQQAFLQQQQGVGGLGGVRPGVGVGGAQRPGGVGAGNLGVAQRPGALGAGNLGVGGGAQRPGGLGTPGAPSLGAPSTAQRPGTLPTQGQFLQQQYQQPNTPNRRRPVYPQQQGVGTVQQPQQNVVGNQPKVPNLSLLPQQVTLPQPQVPVAGVNRPLRVPIRAPSGPQEDYYEDKDDDDE